MFGLVSNHELKVMLRKIMATLVDLEIAVNGVASDVADLKASSDVVNSNVDAALVLIQSLKDQIAAGGSIDPVKFDELVTKLQAADTAGENVKAGLVSANEKLTSV